MNTETVTATPVPVNRRRVWILSIVAAVSLPTALWTIVDSLAGHELVAASGGQTMHVTLPWVVAGAMAPGMIGLGLSMVLRRLTKHSRIVWLIVSITALAGSLGSPLGGTDTTTVLVLMTMHLMVGAAIIPGGLKLTTR